EVELKDLPPHLEYAFLEGTDKLPVIIAKDLKYKEKAALIKGGQLFLIKGRGTRVLVLSRCEEAQRTYLSHLDKMLKRCEDTNLCLNWEKSHKMAKNEIEVDKAKVDVIAKLPHPTTVKGI
ncbi:hypothetical protein Tco_1332215, partial [Tanacetum coccineum]